MPETKHLQRLSRRARRIHSRLQAEIQDCRDIYQAMNSHMDCIFNGESILIGESRCAGVLVWGENPFGEKP